MAKEYTLEELIDGFMKLSTPTVSDACDKLEINCGCEGLKPVIPGHKFVGPAYTVRYLPRGLVKTKAGDYIDDAKAGDVVVIDNGGRTNCTVWGDILTFVSKKKGIKATVIDGVCRDVDSIKELDYAIYTKGTYMVTGKDRVECVEIGGNVKLCDVLVCPGDLVMADDTGVLVIPRSKACEILETANTIEEAEQNIRKAVAEGSTLVAARGKFKYDSLQRPVK